VRALPLHTSFSPRSCLSSSIAFSHSQRRTAEFSVQAVRWPVTLAFRISYIIKLKPTSAVALCVTEVCACALALVLALQLYFPVSSNCLKFLKRCKNASENKKCSHLWCSWQFVCRPATGAWHQCKLLNLICTPIYTCVYIPLYEKITFKKEN